MGLFTFYIQESVLFESLNFNLNALRCMSPLPISSMHVSRLQTFDPRLERNVRNAWHKVRVSNIKSLQPHLGIFWLHFCHEYLDCHDASGTMCQFARRALGHARRVLKPLARKHTTKADSHQEGGSVLRGQNFCLLT